MHITYKNLVVVSRLLVSVASILFGPRCCGSPSSGYCHFNDGGAGKNRYFNISLFGHDLMIMQNPDSRVLGHGAVVWDAAVVFAKYMEHNLSQKEFSTTKLSSQTVIELGSGCGLAGIAYMLRGAAVTLTDLPAVVDALTEKNANTIFSQVALTSSASDEPELTGFKRPLVFPIDWTESLKKTEDKESDRRAGDGEDKEIEVQSKNQSNSRNIAKQCYDVILLTDCVFSASLSEALVATIQRFCGEKSSVICCHEIRDEQANDAFLQEFSRHFDWKRTPRSKLHPDFNNDLIEIIVGKPLRQK
eukprot:gene35015-47049_t